MMAAEYLEAVRTVQPHGPYLLGGWSMGGLIASEMARQLEEQDEEVELLALFDTRTWNAEKESEPIHDESLLASFALHLGLSPEQLQDAADALLQIQTDDYLSFLLDHLKAARIIPDDMSLTRLRQQFEVFNANVSAARSYRPKNLPASTVLFRAAERSPGADPTLGWEKLEVYDTPGSHMTIMQEPNVSILAERLAECFATKRRRHKNPS